MRLNVNIFAKSFVKMLIVTVILAFIFGCILYWILSNEDFLLYHFLSSQYLESLSDMMDIVVEDIGRAIFNNMFITFITTLSVCLFWFLLGASAKIQDPGQVKKYKKWWWILFILGFFIVSLICYYFCYSIDIELRTEGFIWIGSMNLIFYCLVYYLETLFCSPLVIQPVVPMASKIN